VNAYRKENEEFNRELYCDELKNRLETMSLDVFLKEKYDELKKDFEYSSKKLKEQEENCEESNIWIEALFKSLGEL